MVQILVAAPQGALGALPAHTDGLEFDWAGSAAEVLDRLKAAPSPDLVLLDFDFPGLSGLKGIQITRSLIGDRPIGVLVPGTPLELARRLFIAGADAVLPRATQGAALVSTVNLLVDGGRFVIFTPEHQPDRKRATDHLSERELQVLQGICDGLQNKEIAHAFQVQEVTVKMHVRAIIRKLGARNRTQAAMIARDLGIV